MGINQTHSMSKGDMLQNQISQQCRFPRTSFPDHVDVLALGKGRYAEKLGFTPALAFADCDGVVIHDAKTSHHSCHSENPACIGLPLWSHRQMLFGAADEVMVTGFEIRMIPC